ncbi:MAG: hypothetical protein AB7O32_19345 [Vicinamibacterales bacterium]
MNPRTATRALAVWLLIAIAETVHGTARALWLVPRIGDLASRQVGVFTGAAIILVIAVLTRRWIGADRRELWLVGLLWLALMLAFEVGLGRAFGFSWSRILADYDPRQGGLMPLGLAVLALAPRLAAMRTDPGGSDGRSTTAPH